MPKIVERPKTRTQIQAESDAKRGIKIKAFKFKIEDIQFIEQTAKDLDLNQNELVLKAIHFYLDNHKS
ncbi:hypothetical protein [Moraxella sp. ZY210820]|uniref:hypothetical protein n=1 Tax=Moraxella sp. ZY210820 TaxID=2904123 RepID=UPI0027302AF1|nr:hypothetical protein [Moraxella sp. ZY210820]WLF84847.1 hypothetical protein LU301_05120 [Moraxella sp. ZY210820]